MSAVVYRIYNECGDLLYVGCSISLGSRIDAHVSRKDWSAEVANVTVHHFASQMEALAEEARAILEERPKYNRLVTTPRGGLLGRPRLGEVRAKLWLAAGMSRRTWYRRKAEERANAKIHR
jgi:hypothetical protein